MLKQSKVAIFSDLHLGIYGNSELWHGVALKWADWVVTTLRSERVKDILFLGDFFHNRTEISVQTLHVASQILEKFQEFNIVMVVGNHDAYYKHRADVHSLGLIQGHDNIHIVDKNFETLEFGKKLLFVPWNAELPDGKFDYIFGHFEIQNFRMNNFKVCDHGLTAIDFLASRTDTVFSGHFHNRNYRVYNEGSIYYVGNTFPMDFADVDNAKGVYMLDIKTGDLEFVENPVSPKFKKLVLSKIKSYTKDDIFNNTVKIILDLETTEEQTAKIKAYIMSFKPFQVFLEYNARTKTINEVEEVDSIDLWEQIDEYMELMKLESDKLKRVEQILKDLYEKFK